ncbi:MAG: hypothetical protein AB1796_12640 [Bacillota bacterium]
MQEKRVWKVKGYLGFILTLMSCIILAPAPATATVPVPSIIAGQDRAVYVSLHYEDASEGMAVIKARLQQDVHALEHVFQSLQETGELDGRYPILLVRAGYHPAAEGGFARQHRAGRQPAEGLYLLYAEL